MSSSTLSIEKIKYLINQKPRTVIEDIPHYRRAAVVVPMIKTGDDWSLLFTKRTSMVRHHKNEISFPGGKYERQQDNDIIETALREIKEELGIDKIQVMGVIDDITTITKFIVTPVVGVIDCDTTVRLSLDSREIDYVLYVPLKVLSHPDNLFFKEIDFNGKIYTIPYFKYNNETIWGATGRILIDFLNRINLINVKPSKIQKRY